MDMIAVIVIMVLIGELIIYVVLTIRVVSVCLKHFLSELAPTLDTLQEAIVSVS